MISRFAFRYGDAIFAAATFNPESLIVVVC